jgi:hypothetical protein
MPEASPAPPLRPRFRGPSRRPPSSPRLDRRGRHWKVRRARTPPPFEDDPSSGEYDNLHVPAIQTARKARATRDPRAIMVPSDASEGEHR